MGEKPTQDTSARLGEFKEGELNDPNKKEGVKMTIQKIVDEWKEAPAKENWEDDIKQLKKSLTEFVEKEINSWSYKKFYKKAFPRLEVMDLKSRLLGTDEKEAQP